MQTSDLSKVVSSAVVPVVIISSCGLLALAFYNRMAAIVSRLRSFQRERLLELESHRKFQIAVWASAAGTSRTANRPRQTPG